MDALQLLLADKVSRRTGQPHPLMVDYVDEDRDLQVACSDSFGHYACGVANGTAGHF